MMGCGLAGRIEGTMRLESVKCDNAIGAAGFSTAEAGVAFSARAMNASTSL